jgi:sec-independent protein translocase protein TatB
MLGSVSWDQLFMLLAAAPVVLGPKRLLDAVRWATRTLRQARDAVSGAAEQGTTQFGPELAEMREPLAVLAETRAQLRDLTAATLFAYPPPSPSDTGAAPAPAQSANPPFDPHAT